MVLANTWLWLECEMSSTDLSVWTLVLRGQGGLEGRGTFQGQILARGSGPLGFEIFITQLHFLVTVCTLTKDECDWLPPFPVIKLTTQWATSP